MRRHDCVRALALGALFPLGTRKTVGQTLEKIRIAGPFSENVTNIYYGITSGMFRRAGLDVEMVPTPSGAAATTAVIGGSYEITMGGSPLPLFAAHLRGLPLSVVAPGLVISAKDPYALLQVAVDSTYKTGADLNGKTIGAPSLSDSITLGTKAWVDKTGGNWRSLKFVELPLSAMPAAIAAHRVDAGMLWSSELDASLAEGTTKTLADAYAALAPVFLAGICTARTDWIAQHTDALRRFNRVFAEATYYVNGHPAETAPLVAELTKIPNAAKMKRSQDAANLDNAVPLLQPLIDAAARYEQLPRSFSAREIVWSDPGPRRPV